MPVGNAYATGNIIAFIEQFHLNNNKLKVLDIGCGIGHNGFIFREMFEIRYKRLKPKDWMHKIIAIEIFEDYRNPTWDYVYDEVLICDCRRAISNLEENKYDIIFATEVLEHFTKEDIHTIIDGLLTKLTSVGSIIITIPLGEEGVVLEQKEIFNNPHETHLSHITVKDFGKYNIKHRVNDGIFMIGR